MKRKKTRIDVSKEEDARRDWDGSCMSVHRYHGTATTQPPPHPCPHNRITTSPHCPLPPQRPNHHRPHCPRSPQSNHMYLVASNIEEHAGDDGGGAGREPVVLVVAIVVIVGLVAVKGNAHDGQSKKHERDPHEKQPAPPCGLRFWDFVFLNLV